MTETEKYIARTGETLDDVLQGASTYGISFILKELIPKANAENKKIIWEPRFVNGQNLGQADWKLQ